MRRRRGPDKGRRRVPGGALGLPRASPTPLSAELNSKTQVEATNKIANFVQQVAE